MAKRKAKKESTADTNLPAAADPEHVATNIIVRSKPYVIALAVILVAIIIIAIIRDQAAQREAQASARAYSQLDQALADYEEVNDRYQFLQQQRFQVESRIEYMAEMLGGRENQFLQQSVQQAAEIDQDLISEETEYQRELAELSDKLQAVIDQHPDSGAAVDARFYLATAAYRKGDYKQAAAAYSKFFKNHSDREPLASLARLNAIDAMIATKQFKQARGLAVAAAGPGTLDTEGLRAQANLKAAFCAALDGDYKAARQQLAAVESVRSVDEVIRSKATDLKNLLDTIPPEQFKQLADGLPTPGVAATETPEPAAPAPTE